MAEALMLADGAQVALTAGRIDVRAGVTTHGGDIKLSNTFVSPDASTKPRALSKAGEVAAIVLREGAALDASGRWVDLQGRGVASPWLGRLDGGRVTLDSPHGIAVAAGSLIDVSSGGAVLHKGETRAGKGGDVTLRAGTPEVEGAQGALKMAGQLRSYGMAGGGTLTLETDGTVVIGGADALASTLANTPAGAQQPKLQPQPLLLDPSLLRTGFAKYDINGRNGLRVADGTVLDVAMPVYRYEPGDEATGLRPAPALLLPPAYQEDPFRGALTQRAGVDLTLRSQRQDHEGGHLRIGAGAVVSVDPGRSITLLGGGSSSIVVDGRLNAWGGAISLDINGPATNNPKTSLQPHARSIWIGEQGVLDVAGRAVSATAVDGRRYGKLANGGTIAIGGKLDWDASGKATAPDVAVVLRPGARLDASGVSAVFDYQDGARTRTVAVASDGGSIVLKSSHSLHLDGAMAARAGGAGAAGGTLAIALETPVFPVWVAPDDALRAQREFTISQHAQDSGLPAGIQPGQAALASRYGAGRLSADQLAAGGFDNLSLLVNGILGFDGDVSLSARQSLRLYAGAYGLTERAAAGSAVRLATSHLRLAGATGDVTDSDAMYSVNWRKGASRRASDARFSAEADLIEVRDRAGFGGANGSIEQQAGPAVTIDRRGFADVELYSRGDLRLLGGTAARGLAGKTTTELAATGNLTITAAQIYPAADVDAQIVAGYQPGNTLEIRRHAGADPAAPASVFGRLLLGANTLRQGGIVRAPLGQLVLGTDARGASAVRAERTELLPGSITSVSAAGLILPYGGTVDGLAYQYSGTTITPRPLGASGITLVGDNVVGAAGAVLDLSGGGNLTGAGFIPGRGGSVDILRTPLANANPVFKNSAAGNAVYAIVPGYADHYAPVLADAGAGQPLAGQQVTLQQDAGGLKAGTYTLLPSTYAMLPGAYRVEIGPQAMPGAPSVVNGYGSQVATGYLGVANTGILKSLPNQLLVTSGDVLRKHASYNETGYDAFVVADAARKGGMRGQIAADAHDLTLDYRYFKPRPDKPLLDFNGVARFGRGDQSGLGGTLMVQGYRLEILPDGGVASAPDAAGLHASDLNKFGASRMILGGSLAMRHGDNVATFRAEAWELTLRSGAVLRAPEVFLLSQASFAEGTRIERGASINTLGMGAAAYDSTRGVTFEAGNASVLGLSNGWINLMAPEEGLSKISVGECLSVGPCAGESTLYAQGTMAVATNRSFSMSDHVRYGARNMVLAVSAVNMGSDAALARAAAAGQLPSGMSMNQDVLSRLLAGNAGAGVPAVENLIFNARDAVNMYGPVELDARGGATGKPALQRLVIGAPAIYGYGAAGDTALIRAPEIVWTGTMPKRSDGGSADVTRPQAGAAIAGLLGDGALALAADRIVLGYAPGTQPAAGGVSERLALGFGQVRLNAAESLSANGSGTLAIHHRQGAYVAGKGYAYSGGELLINTPLLKGAAASVSRISAGGDIVVRGPAGQTGSDALGAELKLAARNIVLDARVALPSGKLSLEADQDIRLGDGAQLDLGGRAVGFFEQTRYSQGGDLILRSRTGNIAQAAGSSIDLSARNNNAGTLQAVALGAAAGRIALDGRILGGASGRYDAGGTWVPHAGAEITLRGQTVADFAGLNARLNDGQAFGARRFQIKQGDLTVGDEVRARQVSISVDNGSLTVAGRIDASGFQTGAISLAAGRDLTVLGTLDAHGTGLRRDSYGFIIDSPNRALVSLTARDGTLTLGPQARIDLRAGTEAAGHDGRARGTLDLNASRTGATDGSRDGAGANDVALVVQGRPQVQGAATVALNAFRSYKDEPLADTPDVSGATPQLITQKFLEERIDRDNSAFIDAALANTALAARLAGLGEYRLRPGAEIVSDPTINPSGNLAVVGDLDLSGLRYGPGANRADPARRGFGEPGVLVLRAAGDLAVYGSINDGFAPPPATPDEKGWYLIEARGANARPATLGNDVVLPIDGVVLETGTLFPRNATLNYDVPVAAMSLPAGTLLPADAKLTTAYTLPAGVVVAANVYKADGTLAVAAGTVPSADIRLSAGMRLGAGTRLQQDAGVAPMVWPKGAALPVDVTTTGNITLARGAFIPSMAKVQLPNDEPVALRPESGGSQGRNWAVAPMLPAGTTSWSLQMTAGADLASSDRGATAPYAQGSVVLADPHAMLRMTSVASGSGMIWLDHRITTALRKKPGDPVEEQNVRYCTSTPAACAIDPKRISYTYTAAGSIAAVGDNSLVGKKIPDNVIAGGFCTAGPGRCTQVVAPVAQVTTANLYSPMFSVLRTGTGDLGLNAARDVSMMSPFGVYTAGTPSQALLDASGANPYNLARGKVNGSIIGMSNAAYNAALSAYQAWYPEAGGNLTVSAGRNITGDVWGSQASNQRAQLPSAGVGNWLWRQGTGGIGGADAVPAAWWINFGTYTAPFSTATDLPYLTGFTGWGTLGGGNLSITAGGDAGIISMRGDQGAQVYARSQALVAVVGSTGRVGADGGMTLTGGGDLSLRVGGTINPNFTLAQYGSGGSNNQNGDLNGVLVNLRGMTVVDAGAVGIVQPRYRSGQLAVAGGDADAGEVRAIDPFKATNSVVSGGLMLMPGDSPVYLDTRRDLVVQDAGDPGRVYINQKTPYSVNGVSYDGGGQSWFSLWTPATALNLFAAGGNLTPGTQAANRYAIGGNGNQVDTLSVYPSILRATAASGDVYYGYSIGTGMNRGDNGGMILAPSPSGALEMLAAGSLYGGLYGISMSSSDAPLPSPRRPAFLGVDAYGNYVPAASNVSREGSASSNGRFDGVAGVGLSVVNELFAFGPDTPSDRSLHAGDASSALFYAAGGDIIGLNTGWLQSFPASTQRSVLTWYRAALPARILASRDIVSARGLALHNNASDVSLLHAGRDIWYADMKVAGPGLLDVVAGRNLVQEDRASIVSVGPALRGDKRPGADIAITAGAGAAGPDYAALGKLYLDPANRAVAGQTLTSQPGKVVHTYERELADWLRVQDGYTGSDQDVLARFEALPLALRQTFLRSVYFAELRAGGREYNDLQGPRPGSYLRGRQAIAALFPEGAAHDGSISMFGPSGVRSVSGGSIQMLAPGGQVVVGVQGVAPPGSAGLITQGQGDIQVYSKGSLLLGLSRVMTTFGGDILAWSAEGDINAGRGSKTTVVYTPPRRDYDALGNVVMAPQTPAAGAGIATLNPIPEVPRGDVDLIAPLGTIDPGEAGVRSSGNVNVAALHVVNAANIQAQGNSSGVPVTAAVNTSALSSASAASGAAAASAEGEANRSRNAARQSQPSIISVQILGFGNEGAEGATQAPAGGSAGSSVSYDPASAVRILGLGELPAQAQRQLTERERGNLGAL
ncbi:filamentous hemagglutinin family protein [Achromobacter sp. Marseille-Q0513]|uniref:filamentous haemagglutinin family protein n=1 Tax=Achromobacter sp. Marseille-Q0513 TaxID=2829161 RepID=UPI001B96CCBA|nr:filamentous haemagglutinin family protein [Achromobacter sp. Marseille-Q0513]MBR8654986.1 filamentous hemagglutinin family protein [Achromobacter sp. Marseille-Q0513]